MTTTERKPRAPKHADELMHIIGKLHEANHQLRRQNAELDRQLVEARSGNEAAEAMRRAALNLTEDAVAARRAEQAENVERKRVEEQLRRADRRKDEFLATLAHELRNPLAPIRSSLEVLKLTDPGNMSTRAVRQMIERQVSHLVRLVDDLMEISRITRGTIKLRPERIELSDIIRNAVELSKPMIHAARHELTVDLPGEPVFLRADPVRLSQVISNLLNNAAKYTDAGGRITLNARRHGDVVEISVRDTGVGIPPEMLASVFDLFTQIDRTLGRAQGGLGIGLSLVRSLVEAHGGTVEARSAGPGLGSEFVVRLPDDPTHACHPVSDGIAPQSPL